MHRSTMGRRPSATLLQGPTYVSRASTGLTNQYKIIHTHTLESYGALLVCTQHYTKDCASRPHVMGLGQMWSEHRRLQGCKVAKVAT